MSALRLVTRDGQAVEVEAKRMRDGFVAIPNHLFDAILSADIPARHMKVAMAVIRKTIGFGKAEDDCTIQQLADVAGIHRPDASKAFHALVEAKIISARVGKYGYLVSVNDPEMWDLSPYKNATHSATNVAKRYERTEQNATHNRQSQKTSSSCLLPTVVNNMPAAPGKPEKRSPATNVSADLVALYHERCESLPKVKLLTDSRRQAIRHRWMQAGRYMGRYDPRDVAAGLAWWSRFFDAVEGSDFLTGRASSFKAGLDWLLKQANFLKIVEGNYDNGAQHGR